MIDLLGNRRLHARVRCPAHQILRPTHVGGRKMSSNPNTDVGSSGPVP
jgi:hypothetical protein